MPSKTKVEMAHRGRGAGMTGVRVTGRGGRDGTVTQVLFADSERPMLAVLFDGADKPVLFTALELGAVIA